MYLFTYMLILFYSILNLYVKRIYKSNVGIFAIQVSFKGKIV